MRYRVTDPENTDLDGDPEPTEISASDPITAAVLAVQLWQAQCWFLESDHPHPVDVVDVRDPMIVHRIQVSYSRAPQWRGVKP